MPTKGHVEMRRKYNKENGWRYGGGRQKKVFIEHDQSYDYQVTKHSRYYEQDLRPQWNKLGFNCLNYFPSKKEYCLCGHWIRENCFIYRKRNEKTIDIRVIGNCCITLYDLSGKHCEMCDAVHQNRKDNLCNTCRKEVKDTEKRKLTHCKCGQKKKKKHPLCYYCYTH
tara:strand:+ start:1733 stop:2236 length:504 start_codon:yes stop_codon:yes gene_type:complete